MLIIDSDLERERMRPAGQRPSPGYWLSTELFAVDLAMTGLDRGRLHWSDTVPVWLRVAALLLFGLVWRTVIEDRMLRAELSGYADYAARVKRRLLPGVW